MAADTKKIQQTLTQQIRSRLRPEEIVQVSDLIARLANEGIEIDDVFPYGVPQSPDAVSLRAHLDAGQLHQLSKLVPTLEGLRDYRVFPRGIVAPERYRLHINLNR